MHTMTDVDVDNQPQVREEDVCPRKTPAEKRDSSIKRAQHDPQRIVR